MWGAAKAFEHLRRHQATSREVGLSDSRIAAYVPDLMDRSKVAAAGDVTFVNRPDGPGRASTPTWWWSTSCARACSTCCPSLSARVIGFARHTEPALMAAAQAAGCDVVLPRSSFFARSDELLAG